MIVEVALDLEPVPQRKRIDRIDAVAIEALRDLMKARPRLDLNEVYRFARLNRVQAVMRPYLEAMV